MLPWELDDWLTELGDHIVKKKASQGFHVLTPTERSVYEVWLFDTEARNGGVSQYFCNEAERWNTLLTVADNPMLPSLKAFAGRVQVRISGAEDPYVAAFNAADELDSAYEQFHTRILEELRAFVEGPPNKV